MNKIRLASFIERFKRFFLFCHVLKDFLTFLNIFSGTLFYICVFSVQLVICIPVPEIALGGRTKRAPSENIELNERPSEEQEMNETLDDMGRRGHILWIRGLTRLQTQV